MRTIPTKSSAAERLGADSTLHKQQRAAPGQMGTDAQTAESRGRPSTEVCTQMACVPPPTVQRVGRKRAVGCRSRRQPFAGAISCVNAPRCSCIPQGAFLVISEDVALPQEEEGTSCRWLCGLSADRHLRHAWVSAVGTGTRLWARALALRWLGATFWKQDLRKADGRNTLGTPALPASRNVLISKGNSKKHVLCWAPK